MRATWRYLKWEAHKLYKRALREVCSELYRETESDTRTSIMVAGTARSGTTWLADIIASQIPCRIMFEPFHSRKVQAFRQFHYFQYMKPGEKNNALRSYCQKVFTGEIRDRWIDQQVDLLFPKCRLIKEIRANLFLGWIQVNFPEIPILFIVRNPCAVVLSRMQLSWWTDEDIAPFLSQPKLIDDFLVDKLEVIRRATTIEEKHAIIWCVSNLVPIRQFRSRGLTVVFYEHLCVQPEVEVRRMFGTIDQVYDGSIFRSVIRPSATSRHTSAIVTGEDKVMRWKQVLSTEQIDNILRVVRDFGLDYIYGDSAAPLVAEP